MPHVVLTITDERVEEEKTDYKKYLDPTEYNVLIQNKFQEWQEQASETFTKLLGEDILKPAGNHDKVGKNLFIFERTSSEIEEGSFFHKEMNH